MTPMTFVDVIAEEFPNEFLALVKMANEGTMGFSTSTTEWGTGIKAG